MDVINIKFVILIFLMIFFSTISYTQDRNEYSFRKYDTSIYRVSVGCEGKESNSTGFLYEIEGEIGLLTTLHGVCRCDYLGRVATNKLGDKIRDLKLKYVDLESDVAFLSITNEEDRRRLAEDYVNFILPTYNGEINNISGSRVLYVGFPKSMINSRNLTINHARSLRLFSEFLKDFYGQNVIHRDFYKTWSNLRSPDLNKEFISFDGISGRGYSGSPITIVTRVNGEKDRYVFAILNGGYVSNSMLSFVFGVDLNSVILKSVDDELRKKINVACEFTSDIAFSSGHMNDTRKEEKLENLKPDYTNTNGYYVKFYPNEYDQFIKNDTSVSIILSLDGYSESMPIHMYYFRKIKRKFKNPEDRFMPYVNLFITESEEGKINLNLNISYPNNPNRNYTFIIPPTTENGVSKWNIKNELLDYYVFRKKKSKKNHYKFLYYSLVAEQLDDNSVRIEVFGENSEKKSYIVYPEAKEKEIYYD